MRASLETGASHDQLGRTVRLGYRVDAKPAPIGKIVGVVLIAETGEQARFEIRPPRQLPHGRQFRIDLIDGRAYLG